MIQGWNRVFILYISQEIWLTLPRFTGSLEKNTALPAGYKKLQVGGIEVDKNWSFQRYQGVTLFDRWQQISHSLYHPTNISLSYFIIWVSYCFSLLFVLSRPHEIDIVSFYFCWYSFFPARLLPRPMPHWLIAVLSIDHPLAGTGTSPNASVGSGSYVAIVSDEHLLSNLSSV